MEKRFLQRIDDELLKKQEDRKTRKRSGKFSPSSFGKCYKAQILNRLNYPQEPLGLGTLRIFQIGNMFHEFCQSYYPKHWCEVKIEEEDVLGFADVVTREECVDFKTVNSMAIKYLPQEGDYQKLQASKLGNILQVVWYSMILKKEYARIVFIGKDNFFTVDFVLETDQWKALVEEELVRLREYWKQKKLPEGLPRAYNGKECTYCGFKKACKKGEIKVEGWK